MVSQVAQVVKNLPANAGDRRDAGSIPGSGRSPREGNGNPLQEACLENPMDRGAWWATVHGVAKSQTRLSDFTFCLSFVPLLCPYQVEGMMSYSSLVTELDCEPRHQGFQISISTSISHKAL